MRTVIFIFLSFLLTQESNMTLWSSNEKLNWEDFQGEPPKDKGLKLAVSAVKISVKYKHVEGEIPDFTVKSLFNKLESWSITTSDSHLSHERLHFDITEVYSRKIRCKLKALNELGEKDINIYKETYRKIMKAHREAQKRYDDEVYFSKSIQEEWNQKIMTELDSLKDYKYVIKE